MYETMGDDENLDRYTTETVERVTRAIELNPNDARAWVLGSGAWLKLGDKQKAIEWIEKAQALSPKSSGVMYNSACVQAKMGEPEKALALLEKAVELGSRNKLYFETDADFDSIRDHPRFIALMKTI